MAVKRRTGPPLGSACHAKKPKIPLSSDLEELKTPESVLEMQKLVIGALYRGELGARQAGAINSGLQTLLKFMLDSKKIAEYDALFQRVKNLLDKEETEKKP
jgi:hypothetical protein